MINLILYLSALALFAYGAVLYGSEAMLLLVYSGIAFAVLSYGYLLLEYFTTNIELSVPIPMVEQGKKTEMMVVVKRRYPFLGAKLKGIFVRKNTISDSRKRLKLSGIASSGKKAELFCDVPGKHCGGMEYTLKKARIYDLTGFFYLTKWCRQKAVCYVMPQIYETSVIVTERARNFMSEAEVYDERMPGPDVSEVFDIREFREGDKIQSIHWKMSARMDELMVKENSLPLGCPVVLLFDRTTDEAEMDGILTVTATISCALVEQKCAHYIAWFDGMTGDVTRMRVDAEEDLYQFLLIYYMEEKKGKRVEDLDRLYQEKYRLEHVVERIYISRNLELKVGDNVSRKLHRRKLAEELQNVEIIV